MAFLPDAVSIDFRVAPTSGISFPYPPAMKNGSSFVHTNRHSGSLRYCVAIASFLILNPASTPLAIALTFGSKT